MEIILHCLMTASTLPVVLLRASLWNRMVISHYFIGLSCRIIFSFSLLYNRHETGWVMHIVSWLQETSSLNNLKKVCMIIKNPVLFHSVKLDLRTTVSAADLVFLQHDCIASPIFLRKTQIIKILVSCCCATRSSPP